LYGLAQGTITPLPPHFRTEAYTTVFIGKVYHLPKNRQADARRSPFGMQLPG